MRLIDADALKECFEECRYIFSMYGLYPRNLVQNLVDNAPTVGGWISVKDRLPEKDGKYLTFHNSGFIRVIGFSINLESVDQYEFPGRKRPGWYDYDSEYGYYEWENITYWMPLPEPPEEVQDG